jgi:hypothetical protein
MTHISILHPILLSQILSHLSLRDLYQVALVSRTFNAVTHHDFIYENKLIILGFEFMVRDTDDDEKMLKIELFNLMEYDTGADGGVDKCTEKSDHSMAECVGTNLNTILIKNILPTSAEILNHLGSNGLKGALRSSGNPNNVPKRRNISRYKQIFILLHQILFPLFNSYKFNSKIITRNYKDTKQQGCLLNILEKYSILGLFSTDKSREILNLKNEIQYFESRILGILANSIDENRNLLTVEQKLMADALFLLNGGKNWIALFIAKSPLFYDPMVNPLLLDTILPSAEGSRVGTELADRFIECMQLVLAATINEINLILKMFKASADVIIDITLKLYRECISDCIRATLAATKVREIPSTYLQSIALLFNSCLQFNRFLEQFLKQKDYQLINDEMISFFYDHLKDYQALEISCLTEYCVLIIQKWNKENEMNEPEVVKEAKTNYLMGLINAPAALTNFLTGAKTPDHQPLLDEKCLEDAFEALEIEEELISIKNNSLNTLLSLSLTSQLISRNKASLIRGLVINVNTDITKMYHWFNIVVHSYKQLLQSC